MKIIENIKIERVFLCLAIIFGICISLITPPFQVPDEIVHFDRAYQISKGEIFETKLNNTVGGYIPLSIMQLEVNVSPGLPRHPQKRQNVELLKYYLKQPLNKNVQIFAKFDAPYFPIVYLPQSIGINIGKIFNLSPLLLMYLGRICNLFAWTAIVYQAIKILPISKAMFLILVLTPMSIFQASSLSADVITNSLVFYLFAKILSVVFTENKDVPRKDIFIIMAVTVLVTLSKQAYIGFSLLFLLLVFNKTKDRKKYIKYFLILIFIQLATFLCWNLVIKNFTISSTELSLRINNQLDFIIKHPFYWFGIFINTLIIYKKDYLIQFIGCLGWLDTHFSFNFIKMLFISLIGISLFDNDDEIHISLYQKSILLATSIATMLIIFLLLFITYTSTGSDTIQGIQGRYFIPISPLIFLLLYNNKFKVKRYKLIMTTLCICTLSLVLTIRLLLRRYYGI